MSLDPSITLYGVGASISEGKLVQKAGCCITLEFEDEHGRKSRRVISHPIGNASVNRAHLQAAHLALAAVVRPMRRTANVVLVCPGHVKAILDKSDTDYLESQVYDRDIVSKVRKWTTFYNKLQFALSAAEDIPGFNEAEECAESQSGSDTGTMAA